MNNDSSSSSSSAPSRPLTDQDYYKRHREEEENTDGAKEESPHKRRRVEPAPIDLVSSSSASHEEDEGGEEAPVPPLDVVQVILTPFTQANDILVRHSRAEAEDFAARKNVQLLDRFLRDGKRARRYLERPPSHRVKVDKVIGDMDALLKVAVRKRFLKPNGFYRVAEMEVEGTPSDDEEMADSRDGDVESASLEGPEEADPFIVKGNHHSSDDENDFVEKVKGSVDEDSDEDFDGSSVVSDHDSPVESENE